MVVDFDTSRCRLIAVPIMAGIGNSLMAVPMVRQLARACPGAKLMILARLRVTGECFENLPEVDEVRLTGTRPKSMWAHTRALRRQQPDLYVVPFPSNRWQYTMLAGLSGARVKLMHGYDVGRVRAMGGWPGIVRVPARRGLHDVHQNLALLEAIGVRTDLTEPPLLNLTDAHHAAAERLLRDAGLGAGEGFVAVHAGCRQTVLAAAKRWPAECYGQLVRAIIDRFNLAVVLLEGPEEAGVADEIKPHVARRPVHALRLFGPLGDAGAVLQRAKMYVGSDSGLAHLAAAVGTSPVTLFAPADPDRCSPFGHRHRVIQPRDKPCSPCFTYPFDSPYPRVRCTEPMCIRSVAIEDVIQKVEMTLQTASLTN